MNWGHKIAIVYTLFAGSMVGMLLLSTTYDHELVTEDYYVKELEFQGKIDAATNLVQAAFDADVKLIDGKLKLLFNQLPTSKIVAGEVKFYKPDNEKMDETHPIVMEAGAREMILPSEGKSGRYKVQVSFEIDETAYFKEVEIKL